MHCLAFADKVAIGKALMALRRERTRRKDLDRISMLDWLLQKRQTPHAIDRFWRQVLVSAVNEVLDRMAAVHGFQVFWLGFLASSDGYEMGIPASRSATDTADAWKRMGTCACTSRAPWSASMAKDSRSPASVRPPTDTFALPFERMESMACRRRN
jgi:zeta-carotene desaturase